MKHITIYINGYFKKYPENELSKFAPGEISGHGVFETMTAYDGRVFAFEPHWLRMENGLRLLRIESSYSAKKIQGATQKILQINKLKNARVRVVISKLDGKEYANIIAVESTKPSLSMYKRGYKLRCSAYMRNKGRLTHVKSINYQKLHEAHGHAKKQGYDDALLFNNKNHCVEAAYANIFMVDKNIVLTPPVSSGCLNGITRNIVQVLAQDKGISVKVSDFNRKKILRAEEVFMTNSIIEIMPVTVIDGYKVGNGKPGKITNILADAYAQLVEAFKRENG